MFMFAWNDVVLLLMLLFVDLRCADCDYDSGLCVVMLL